MLQGGLVEECFHPPSWLLTASFAQVACCPGSRATGGLRLNGVGSPSHVLLPPVSATSPLPHPKVESYCRDVQKVAGALAAVGPLRSATAALVQVGWTCGPGLEG
jgi:hypothetical protein